MPRGSVTPRPTAWRSIEPGSTISSLLQSTGSFGRAISAYGPLVGALGGYSVLLYQACSIGQEIQRMANDVKELKAEFKAEFKGLRADMVTKDGFKVALLELELKLMVRVRL